VPTITPTTNALDDIRMVTMRELCSLVGLSRVSIWTLRRAGKFPAGRQLSENRIGWLASDVRAWIESRPRVS
jgi:prophage regulatory protein